MHIQGGEELGNPWLSIITPTYNGEAYLALTLDSIVMQHMNGIECIVVDDESTDSTLEIVNAYKNKLPLKIIQRKRKGDWVANTNYGLMYAKGDYLCFLHQDDLWFRDRLSIMKELIEKFPDANLFLNPSYYLNDMNDIIGIWRCPLPKYPKTTEPDLLIENLIIQNFISIPSAIFKRETALRVGGMEESLWYTADWDFWLKIAACGNGVYYPKPLSGFRIHTKSQTVVRSSYEQEFRNQLEQVYKKHWNNWKTAKNNKNRIRKAALFSIEVNTALAGYIHQKKTNYLKLMISFISLGPYQAYRYLKASRIVERVAARLKAQLLFHSHAESNE